METNPNKTPSQLFFIFNQAMRHYTPVPPNTCYSTEFDWPCAAFPGIKANISEIVPFVRAFCLIDWALTIRFRELVKKFFSIALKTDA